MRTERWARWLGNAVGLVGGFVLGYALARSVDAHAPTSTEMVALTTIEGLIFAHLGVPYLIGGWRSVNLRLTGTPLPDLIAALTGVIVGLVLAVLIGFFVRDFPYGVALSAVLALLLAVMGGRLGLSRRHELSAVIGGSEGEAGEAAALPAVLLDTSVIIDGRILDLVRTGFLSVPMVVPRSVLKELQYVADAADATRRARGRRGLEVLQQLQDEAGAVLRFHEDDTSGTLEIDARLVRLARQTGYAVMTNDFNLNRVARLEGVHVLNLNELANALKPIAIPGENLAVTVVKDGKEPNQGIGYLDDGTMVVIENGHRHLNATITVTVTSIHQTAAGRMIFASPQSDPRPAPRRRARSAG